MQFPRAFAQHAVQPEAELRALDLLRIRRAHRRDRVRAHQRALEERRASVILEAVDAAAALGNVEPLDVGVRKHALEREVVDGDESAGTRRAIAQIHGRQRRRPVVAMHDLGAPLERALGAAQDRRDLRQHAKAQHVVVPVVALVVLVGPAGASIKVGRVDHQERHAARQARFEEPRLGAEHLEARQLARAAVGRQDLGIAGQQDPHVDAQVAQRRRQRRAHVAQPAGLRQRRALRGREEYARRMGIFYRRGHA